MTTSMRQVQPVEFNLPPEHVELTIKQLLAAETYYKTHGKINQHNRSQHDNLELECKIKMKRLIDVGQPGNIFDDCCGHVLCLPPIDI